jgi:hypothetical protein
LPRVNRVCRVSGNCSGGAPRERVAKARRHLAGPTISRTTGKIRASEIRGTIIFRASPDAGQAMSREALRLDFYLVGGVSGAAFFPCSVSLVVVGAAFFFFSGAFFLGVGVLTALFEPPQPAEPQPVPWANTVPPEDKSPATVIPARMRFSLSAFILVHLLRDIDIFNITNIIYR